MTAPLLSQDKISFIYKRIFSTLTGWVVSDKLKDNIYQLLIFILPWFAAGLLELFSPLLEIHNIHLIWIGVLFGIVCMAIKFPLFQVNSRLSGLLCLVLVSFLFGIFQVLATVYLSFASFQSVFVNHGLQITLYSLSWISVNIAQLVLLRGYVPEPNTYYAEHSVWDEITRALYLIIILICFALEKVFSDLAIPNYYLHYVFAFFPLITVSGFLPRFDIFMVYAFEMLSNVYLGIGPHQNEFRSIVDFALSGISLIVFSLLQEYLGGANAIIFLGIVSTLLSSNIILDRFCTRNFSSSKLSILSVIARVLISGLLIGFGKYLISAISTICLALITMIFITSEIQQELVPSIFPIFHNPFKRKIRFSKSPVIANFAFSVGYLHLACTYLAPVFISVWITTSYDEPVGYYTNSFPSRLLVGIYNGLFYSRAFRNTWQNVRNVALDIYIICICAYFSQFSVTFQTINPPFLFAISYFRQASFRFIAKMWFWGLSLVHFCRSKKNVLNRWYIYLIPAIIVSPISIALSSVLNAPVMPLLGLPIFWMGFLRPKRMWPNIERTCSIGEEAKIYSSLCPSLLGSISKSISMGRILPLEQGTILVARFESRILMIRCLESSFDDTKVMVMGAELEQTSCHSLEGTELDAVLDHSLNSVSEKPVLNQYLFHTVLPLEIVFADAYSESKLVTTGILDSKETLALIPIIYFKVLVHHLLAGLDSNSLEIYQNPPIHSTILANCWKKFPVKWFEYVQIHSKHLLQKNTDQELMLIATTCYIIMLGLGAAVDSEISMNTNSMYELYRGDLPHSTQIDLRNWFMHPSRMKLRRICLQSFRSAVKLSIDQYIEGEPQSLGELLHILETYLKEWLITIDPIQIGQNDKWSKPENLQNAIDSEIPNLFFLSRKKDGIISVRLLTRQLSPVKLACVNSEAVMGIWSNLVLEMLYITNDDDERYSIQAHEKLLRNITIQLASPPFGYPVWTTHGVLKHDRLHKTILCNFKRVSPRF